MPVPPPALSLENSSLAWHTPGMPDYDHAAPISPDLDELFPAGVVSVLSLAARMPDGRLLPAEAAATQAFSPERLAEFTHGRDCARRALRRLGTGDLAIPVGPHREPLWPAGVVGSISHAGPAAAAVVAWKAHVATIGLDLEPTLPLEPELLPLICRPEELAVIRASGSNPTEMARLIFSMKEAAYKALWPILRCFLDFQDLEIGMVPGASAFTIRSHSDRCPQALAASLIGKFTRRGAFMVSVVYASR